MRNISQKRLVAAVIGSTLSGAACVGPGGEPTQPPPDTGLVSNGSFERDGGALADGWHFAEGDASTVARTKGATGFQMMFTGQVLRYDLISSDPISVSGGVRYSFSLEYYQPTGDGFTSGARYEVRWLDLSKSLVGQSILEGTAVGRWTVLQHTVTAPERAAYAVLIVGRAQRPTTLTIDNVSLHERR